MCVWLAGCPSCRGCSGWRARASLPWMCSATGCCGWRRRSWVFWPTFRDLLFCFLYGRLLSGVSSDVTKQRRQASLSDCHKQHSRDGAQNIVPGCSEQLIPRDQGVHMACSLLLRDADTERPQGVYMACLLLHHMQRGCVQYMLHTLHVAGARWCHLSIACFAWYILRVEKGATGDPHSAGDMIRR